MMQLGILPLGAEVYPWAAYYLSAWYSRSDSNCVLVTVLATGKQGNPCC